MNDLISREAAIKSIKLWRGMLSVETAVAEISAIPAVDAAPVVRCRECKRCDGFPGPDIDQNEVGICKNTMITVKPNDYCSYGVRMDLPEGEEEQNYD